MLGRGDATAILAPWQAGYHRRPLGLAACAVIDHFRCTWTQIGGIMSNLGVFHWLRDAVRRSVLLGFSDAVEQLGVPSDSNDVNPQLLAVLRQTTSPALEDTSTPRSQPRAERKRLGRSLDHLRETAIKPAGDPPRAE